MFTGIIRSLGTVLNRAPNLLVRTPFKNVRKGDSVAVDGVCLTALKIRRLARGADVHFECSQETMEKSTLEKLEKGSVVNLELPLRAGEAFGGHFVQGHVDGVGRIVKRASQTRSCLYFFSYPARLKPYLVPKGSIAVNGISLTILNIANGRFSVSILPYTEQETSLRSRREGDAVNLEADILAKVAAKNASICNS